MDLANPDLLFVRAEGPLGCELGGEIALLNTQTKLYFGLKGVGAAVWSELETPKGLKQLIDAVTSRYDVSSERCRADLLQFLAALMERGLIKAEVVAA